MIKHFTLPPFTHLKSCKTLTNFQQIHVHIIKKGLHNDLYIISNFISRFFDRFNMNNNNNKNSFDYQTSVFNSVVYPHDCLCNAFLKGCFDYHSSLNYSLSVLSGLRVSGFCPDEYTFLPLIKRCSRELNGFVGFGVHGLSIKYGIMYDSYVGSSLVDFYGKFMLLGNAQKVFDEMPVRDVVSWTALMEACVNYGDLGRARKVFDEMPVRDVVSWTALMEACVNYGDLGRARRVFDEMPKRNHVSWYVMISGYLRKGEFDEAKRLFYKMPSKSFVTFTTMFDGYAKSGSAWLLFNQCWEKDCSFWTALIFGYLQNGQTDEAVKCFREMLGSIIRPDEFNMVKLISACTQLENLHLATELDSFVMNCSSFDHCRPDVVAALVDMNAKCGNKERAIYLFYSWSRNQ